MKTKRVTAAALAGAALAALLGACAGGSGSSGFLSEAAVIQDVLDQGQCMDLDGLEICPAEVLPTPLPTSPAPQPTATPSPSETPGIPQTTPTGEATPDPFATVTPTAVEAQSPSPAPTTPPTASPTATTIPGTGIDVVHAPSVAADCGGLASSSPCLVLQLQARGFPDGSVFYLASRAFGSDDPWQLSPTVLATDVPAGAPALDAAVPLPPDANAGSDQSGAAQLVVLAFFAQPSDLPASVDRLADSGADQAFALEPVFF